MFCVRTVCAVISISEKLNNCLESSGNLILSFSCMNHGFVQKIIEERHYVYFHRQTHNGMFFTLIFGDIFFITNFSKLCSR